MDKHPTRREYQLRDHYYGAHFTLTSFAGEPALIVEFQRIGYVRCMREASLTISKLTCLMIPTLLTSHVN